MLHLPMAAVGETIGLPESAWADLPRWAMAGVAPEDPHFADGTAAETLRKAHHRVIALFSDLVQHRQAHPGDDVVSVLLGLDFGGRPMDAHEVLLNLYSFAMGAVTTTAQVASHLVLALAERPDAWQLLRTRPELVPSAVEEALRWASPTNHLLRRTLAPVEVAGTRLGKGELVAAWVASANRDESVFADPYRFDPQRTPNPHLAFGLGPHRCIGGPPAQLVLGLLLEEMLARLDDFQVVGPVTHLRSNFINGITQPSGGVPARRGPPVGGDRMSGTTPDIAVRREEKETLFGLPGRPPPRWRTSWSPCGASTSRSSRSAWTTTSSSWAAIRCSRRSCWWPSSARWGVPVSATTLYLSPTVAELAEAIEELRSEEPRDG
jgi:hypothetical protein